MGYSYCGMGLFRSEQLLKALRTDVVTHIVSNGWPLLGIAAHTGEIEQQTLAALPPLVGSYGLRVVRLGNFTIGLKDEDEARLKFCHNCGQTLTPG